MEIPIIQREQIKKRKVVHSSSTGELYPHQVRREEGGEVSRKDSKYYK